MFRGKKNRDEFAPEMVQLFCCGEAGWEGKISRMCGFA
jgi:hypothetical protein